MFPDRSIHNAAVCTEYIMDRSTCLLLYQYAILSWMLIINNRKCIKTSKNIKMRKLKVDQANRHRQAVPNQSLRQVRSNPQLRDKNWSRQKQFRQINQSRLILNSKEGHFKWFLSGSEFGGSAGVTDYLKEQQQWISFCSLSIIVTTIYSVN